MRRIGNHKKRLATEDYVVLDLLRREAAVPDGLQTRLLHLRGLGLIERVGYGKGTHYVLSSRYYDYAGKQVTRPTRTTPEREAEKALVLEHITEQGQQGSALSELRELLPHLSAGQVQRLLARLREEGQVHPLGRTRYTRWYPGPETNLNNRDKPD